MFDMMRMAENIRMYRIRKGLNQYEFAEKLSISPQAVSKWECGQSCPSIEKLCMISEILNVSLDTLLGEADESERVMIGLDGSGIKTEFVLFAETGRILDRIELTGCNPNTVGMDKAIQVLELGIDTLMKIRSRISGIFIGAAGMDSGNNTSRMKKLLRDRYPKIRIRCENDIFNVIGCGKDLGQCIAAICGTGVIVYANENGKLKHYGGRGYLLDQGGSGFHIGRDAVCAAQDARDGIGELTLLTELVEERLGGTVWENIQKIYREDPSYLASFAPCVFRAYENGDSVASKILEHNADCLAELISCASQQCDCGDYVVASGSILKNGSGFSQLVQTKLPEKLILDVPKYPPVYGACVMCCHLCSIDPQPLKETFLFYYESYE